MSPSSGAAVRATPEPSTSWLARELADTAVRRPRLYAALRRTWARPWLVVVTLTALVDGVLGAVITGGDALWFRTAGAGMIGPGFLDVLADRGLQIGPLYLFLLGLATRVLETLGGPLLFTLAAVQAGALVWFAMWTARRAARLNGLSELPAQWAVGIALGLGGFVAESIGNGHPEEILVGLLLANAALSAGRGRFAFAGVLIGLATGMKQWGIIGAGVLLTGRRLRGTAVGGLALVATVAALYLPFALGGDVNTFDKQWGFVHESVLTVVAGWISGADWVFRILQGAIAGLTGMAVAWRRYGSPLVAVICVIAARLLFDPMRLTYYAGPLVAVALVWLWTTDAPVVRRCRLAITIATPAVVIAPYVLPLVPLWRLGDALLIAVPVACLLVERGMHRRRGVGASEADTAPEATLHPCPSTPPSPVHASS